MIAGLRRWLHAHEHPQRHACFTRLLRTQSLSRAALLEQQQRDLAGIVGHAAAHVPYYRERLAGLEAAALADLPILTKDAVRAHLDDLLTLGPERAQAQLGHTGGSTGQPLAFWYDEAKHELMRAGMMRGFMMSGWRPGQKVLYLWGARHDTARGGVFSATAWQDFINAEKTLTAVEYSPAKLDAWARTIQTWRPTLLYGYASALDQLARHVLARGLTMPKGLIGVYSTAEMLDEASRARMEEAFACKVFNQYGCREVPNIAWECRHGGMHVFADLVVLESLPDQRLLVTSLTNRLMPFIRYELGDSGRLLAGECPCGSPFPLLEMGLCRHNDLIRSRDGRIFHPAYFNRLLYGRSEIRQYQWVQTAPTRMVLNLVADVPLNAPLDAAWVETLRASLIRDIDPSMQLDVVQLPEIPRTAAGKHRFVIGL